MFKVFHSNCDPHEKFFLKRFSYIRYVTIVEIKIKIFMSEIWKRVDPI